MCVMHVGVFRMAFQYIWFPINLNNECAHTHAHTHAHAPLGFRGHLMLIIFLFLSSTHHNGEGLQMEMASTPQCD
jgi:hypothetical protein